MHSGLSQEGTNYEQLALLYNERGEGAIRESLVHLSISQYGGQTFNDVLQKPTVKNILTGLRGAGPYETLTTQQWKQLYNDKDVPTKISQIDLRLCFILLRNICNQNIIPTSPDDSCSNKDKGLEWGVAKLQSVGNDLCHCKGRLSNTDFEVKFGLTEKAMLTIADILTHWSITEDELQSYRHRQITEEVSKELPKKISFWAQDGVQFKQSEGEMEIYLDRLCKMTMKRWLEMNTLLHQIHLSIGEDFGKYLRTCLVDFYTCSVAHINVNPTDPNETMPIMKIYVNPVMGTPDNKVRHYKELFNLCQNEIEVKRILVLGDTGFGKTSFTFKLAFDWATEREEILKKFENVFLISLRKVQSGQSLAQAIKAQLFEDYEQVDEDKIKDYITGNKNILLILDGLDEMDTNVSPEFMNIVHGKSLAPVCVLITSATWQVEDLTLSSKYIHAKIKGFEITDRKQIISNFVSHFKTMDSRSETRKATKNLLQNITVRNLESISQNPLLLNMLCYLDMDNGTLPNSLSEIYNILLDWLYQRCKIKGKLKDTAKDIFFKMILKLGEFALDGLFRTVPQLYSRQSEVRMKVGDLPFEVGLISTEKIKGKAGANIQYRFLDPSFQEHAVACFLAAKIESGECEKWNEITETLSNANKILDKQRLLLFCSGESEQFAKLVLTFLDKKILQADPRLKGFMLNHTVTKPTNLPKFIREQNVLKLLELEASCLINMKKPSYCLVQYLRLSDSKTIQRAKANGALQSKLKMNGQTYLEILFDCAPHVHKSSLAASGPMKTDRGSQTSLQLIGHADMFSILNEGEDACQTCFKQMRLSVEDDEDFSQNTQRWDKLKPEDASIQCDTCDSRRHIQRHFSQKCQCSTKPTDTNSSRGRERKSSLDTLFDFEETWKEKLLKMDHVDAVGLTAPPVKIAVFVKSEGKDRLERLLNKEIGKTDMAEYFVINDIGDGLQLEQEYPPQMSVDLNSGVDPYVQNLACLIRDMKSEKVQAITCNHGDDQSKAKFFMRSLDGERDIEIGTLDQQVSFDEVTEDGKSDEACGGAEDQGSVLGGSIEYSTINVTQELLEENRKCASASGKKFTITRIYRPKLEGSLNKDRDSRIQFMALMKPSNWFVQKVGSKTGLTSGKVVLHHLTIKKEYNKKKITVDNALIIEGQRKSNETSENEKLERQSDTYPVQETLQDVQQDQFETPTQSEPSLNGSPASNIDSDLFTEPGDSGSAITTIPEGESFDVMALGMHLFKSKLQGKACSVGIHMSSILDRLETERDVVLENYPFVILARNSLNMFNLI